MQKVFHAIAYNPTPSEDSHDTDVWAWTEESLKKELERRLKYLWDEHTSDQEIYGTFDKFKSAWKVRTYWGYPK